MLKSTVRWVNCLFNKQYSSITVLYQWPVTSEWKWQQNCSVQNKKSFILTVTLKLQYKVRFCPKLVQRNYTVWANVEMSTGKG